MKQEKTEIFVDIGSSSVGVGIVHTKSDGSYSLSQVVRSSLQGESLSVQEGIQKRALDALKRAFSLLPPNLSVSAVHLFFAAPWYASTMKVILSESSKPIRISEATVLHSIQKEREGKEKPRDGRHQVESLATSILVNGYETTLNKPLKGTTLSVRTYESEVDKDYFESVKNIILDSFPHASLHFHTFPLAVSQAITTLRSEENYTFIDVGGEITDIGVVEKGVLTSLDSFPEGIRHIQRKLAENSSTGDAASRLTLFVNKELSEQEMLLFKTRFEQAVSEWSAQLTNIISRMSEKVSVSSRIFLMADADALPWLEKALEGTSPIFSEKINLVTQRFFEAELSLEEGGVYDAFLSAEILSLKACTKKFLKIR